MISKFKPPTLILLMVCNLYAITNNAQTDSSIISAIKQAPINYVSSWYTGNAEQMKKALHSSLTKRRVVSKTEVWNVSYEWMLNAVVECKGCIPSSENGQLDVYILDYTDKMASVRVISNEFEDILHLIKCSNQWKIVNALWEYKGNTITEDKSEIIQLVDRNINSYKTKDTTALRSLLLPDFKEKQINSTNTITIIDNTKLIGMVSNASNMCFNEQRVYKIEVLNISLNMASVKILSNEHIEYLHLSYIDDAWYIVNSLRNFSYYGQ